MQISIVTTRDTVFFMVYFFGGYKYKSLFETKK
jgi:hypothetical protein